MVREPIALKWSAFSGCMEWNSVLVKCPVLHVDMGKNVPVR